MFLKTDRLILRTWKDEDREPFAAMNADPEVMQYLFNKLDRKESDELIDRFRNDYARQGYGMMSVERMEKGEFLGFTGIGHHRWFPDEVEIGWRLARFAWGRGYATEAAKACVDYAFKVLALDHLIAITLPENVRSQAVMKRIGMKEDRRTTVEGVDLILYRLPNISNGVKR